MGSNEAGRENGSRWDFVYLIRIQVRGLPPE